MLTPESTLQYSDLIIMCIHFNNYSWCIATLQMEQSRIDSKRRIPVQLFIHAYFAADKILSSNIYKTCHVTKLNYSIKTMSNGPYLMINARNARLH